MSNDAPVEIVPYDVDWPGQFETERRLLVDAIGRWLVDGSVEHIGSTAVPGLDAKPVIDIMAGVESLDGSRAALSVLERHQYCYAQYRTDVMHWLCKPSPAHRTHHLHLVPRGSHLWIEQLAFRDYLRAHDDVAREYAELKRRLADAHRLDREAYTSAKAPFVQRVLRDALRPRSCTDRIC
ncbi:MAG TPA: GrpB family protein [Vicinamibacterales bacterium]|jgi:GrpB-like predicted nucleotidyltransferase (UPF0157 family)